MVNRITNFFKPFIVPKSRVPEYASEEDEIVVRREEKVVRKPALKHRQATKPSRESSASSTPPKLSARTTPPKRSRPSSQEGTTDDDLHHSSPTPSKQRAMMAVSVPSPKREMSPPPKTERAPAPSRAAAASFSSFSTLSSVPISSQTSSKRIVKNGLQAVTNSDSASADDSGDELADIETFIPRKKPRMTPPPAYATRRVPLQGTVKPDHQQTTRLPDHSSRSRSHTPRLPPSPPRTEYKHSLLKMVKANEKQKQQRTRVAEIEAQVAEAEKQRKAQEAMEEATNLDAQTMAAEIAENSEDGERLGTAMERTEALQVEVTYNFFLEKPVKAPRQLFPVKGLGEESFAHIIRDDQAREQACLTGFMADLAAEGRLSPACISWFVRQMVSVPREELCEAYLEVVRLAMLDQAVKMKTRTLSLRILYNTASQGALDDSLNTPNLLQQEEITPLPSSQRQPEDVIKCICKHDEDDGSIVDCESCDTWQHTTCYYPQHDGRKLPDTLSHEGVDCDPRTLDGHAARKRLKASLADQSRKKGASTELARIAPGLPYVVRAMQYMIAGTDVQSIGQAVVDLAFANIDDHVRKDVDMQLTIQDAIEGLLEGLEPADLDRVCDYAKARIFPPTIHPTILLCRLVASLPASSIHAHHLRRRLALYCATESSSTAPLTSSTWYATIIKRLRTAPEYALSSSTDYALLHALISVLDLAIDAGFSDFAFLAPPSAPVPALAPAPVSATSGPLPSFPLFSQQHRDPQTAPKGSSSSKEEKAFNAHLDALAAQLRFMASRVRNAGAAHMTRMEAKEALERVVVRVEGVVRTRGRAKRDVFGGGGGLGGRGERQVRFLEGFVGGEDGGKRGVERKGVESQKGVERAEEDAEADAEGGAAADADAEPACLEKLDGATDEQAEVERRMSAKQAARSLLPELSLVAAAVQGGPATISPPPPPVGGEEEAASSPWPDGMGGLNENENAVDADAGAGPRGAEAGERTVDARAGADVEAEANAEAAAEYTGEDDVLDDVDVDTTMAGTNVRANSGMDDALSDALGAAVGFPTK
ncbi:hypothetical protein B0A55_08122 [Friedmanniomyces simplex]|uniref:Zinc finger PHD-type domain-containing protein n=1 Tax=Friedmanniomyces simplex TaxID=329884 RepID=A0A4U0X0F9_9PEZI|nr:hypothetical protein B0A55_08122 [Friedmanniomyces simplex]